VLKIQIFWDFRLVFLGFFKEFEATEQKLIAQLSCVQFINITVNQRRIGCLIKMISRRFHGGPCLINLLSASGFPGKADHSEIF